MLALERAKPATIRVFLFVLFHQGQICPLKSLQLYVTVLLRFQAAAASVIPLNCQIVLHSDRSSSVQLFHLPPFVYGFVTVVVTARITMG